MNLQKVLDASRGHAGNSSVHQFVYAIKQLIQRLLPNFTGGKTS
jgi:hypothetical protein